MALALAVVLGAVSVVVSVTAGLVAWAWAATPYSGTLPPGRETPAGPVSWGTPAARDDDAAGSAEQLAVAR